MSTPSVISAIQKLRSLLTREDKVKWLGIVGFALCTSLLEVVTASLIVVFAQILNTPETGLRYLGKIGLANDLSANRSLFYFAILVGAVYLIKNLVAAAEVFYQSFAIQKMNYNFKNKLLHRYAKIDYGLYLTRNSSQGINVVGGDAEIMFSSGMISIATTLSECIIFLGLIGMIIFMDPTLAFAIFGISFVLAFIVIKFLMPRFYTFGRKLQEAGVYSIQNLTQFFHAFKEIVLLGKTSVFVDSYQYHSGKKSRIQALQTAINALPRFVIEVLFIGLFVTTIAILCLEHESPIQMIGILGGYLYAGFRLMPGLNRIINHLNMFKSIIPCIELVHSEYTSLGAKENYMDVPNFEFNHQLTFSDVQFQYLNTSKHAIANVNLHINKGECIGIVGETGSGKSTLVDLILGLLRPTNGKILIDDKYPVNSFQWHHHIGYVPQSIYLTDDSIAANIAFGETNIDQDRLQHAIDAAQLRKYIDQLPNGTSTLVGERGIRLSGGERQRIAIARALYRNPEVLIFDEATSALDNETEARLMETINAVSKNRTVIMIAHRLTTLKNCNRIVMMENGLIKDTVTYESLMPLQV